MDWSQDTTADLLEFVFEYARCQAMCEHVDDDTSALEYAGYVDGIRAELARRNVNVVRTGVSL